MSASQRDDRSRAMLPRRAFLTGAATFAGSAVLTGAAGPSAGRPASPPRGPDPWDRTLVTNVRGYTLVGGRSPRLHAFRSLLISGDGRVEAIDPDRVTGPRPQRLDGQGRVLLPGFIDAHGHLLSMGSSLFALNLDDTSSLEGMLRKLDQYAQEHPELEWVVGRGWEETEWKVGRYPTKTDLDSVVSERPVWLTRVDGHAGVANSKALQIAGVTAETEAPAGGKIVRNESGEPTGVLVDAAQSLVTRHIPEPTLEEKRGWVLAAQKQLNKVGLTSVHDMYASQQELELYHKLAATDELTVRLNSALDWDTFTEIGDQVRTDSFARDMLRVRTVKMAMDGALGSRGAALLEPYADKPGYRGLLQMSTEELTDRLERIAKAGYQGAIHAIGDRANRVTLDAYEKALPPRHRRAVRHRIEHAQILDKRDIRRFGELDIIASMQPTHAVLDMEMAVPRLGRERVIEGGYAWQSLLDQQALLASSSDFPVASENPFDGMHAAVTRTDYTGNPRGGWFAADAMTPIQAFRSFTLDAAYSAHQEGILGTLEPGKWADFILIDQDPFVLPPGRALHQTKVLQTWVAGRQVGQYGAL